MLALRPRVTEATYEEIAVYRPRYGSLFDEIATELKEFLSTGSIARARALAADTGELVNHNDYPQFFTGDLDAELVFVHLNPKQPAGGSESYQGPFPVKTFEEYFDAFRYFGQRMYGTGKARVHKSPFDLKQIRFLRPFGLIDFADEGSKDAVYTNLERVIDRKLQIELIPYGSDHFDARAFPPSTVKPYFERVLRVICAQRRQYVLFCGAVFGPLLREFVGEFVGETHFRLTKKDGTSERMMSSFANVSIKCGPTQVDAGWCRSWARRGIPMAAYGKEVWLRYGK